MQAHSIELKSVSDLLVDEYGDERRFWIPDYQRGYRWTPLQVTQLLDDVWEFVQREAGSRQSFYCLQPVVIKRRSDMSYEVVDGQQRLVTIHILLSYLADIASILGKRSFKIAFATRGSLGEGFLEHIDPNQADDNVDFFHMAAAYKAIETWFSQHDNGMQRLRLLQHLLNDDATGRNVKVIWFELHCSDNPIGAFTRLNIGKIPLTNSELIRSLFLKRMDDDTDTTAFQLQVAHEWDQMEKALQNDAFWCFLSNDVGPPKSRMEFVFDLLVRESGGLATRSHDPYRVFHTYATRINRSRTNQESEWIKVKRTVMLLEEWHVDRTLYHLVGLLVAWDVAVPELVAIANGRKKREFQKTLRAKVFKSAFGQDQPTDLAFDERRELVSGVLADLEYPTDRARIRAVLLLFNVAIHLESANGYSRFDFAAFKGGQWDIEHVRSVARGRPVYRADRRTWFRICREQLQKDESEAELCSQLDSYLTLSADETDDADFERLYKRVLKVFREEDDEDVDDGIGNLVLLDQSTNRSYKNAVFAAKRQRVVALDQSGGFVPLATRNVFLKAYNPKPDTLLFWTRSDRDAYLCAMVDAITHFFDNADQ